MAWQAAAAPFDPQTRGDQVDEPLQSDEDLFDLLFLRTGDVSLSAQTSEDGFPEVEELDQPRETSLPDFFRPDLDMSTAIQALGPATLSIKSSTFVPSPLRLVLEERLDLVPNFYRYSIQSCLLPIRRVQHDLFTLYFRYIHPMFPVVDEYHFNDIHRKYIGQEELMDPLDFMIYHAILAAGFGHLSEGQLRRTFYRSIHAGQEAQFDQVKARYWARLTADPVVLTQLCLIISLWSPGPADEQNNSYWLNLAFRHATAGELDKPEPQMGCRPPRQKLLWWCCLVRDRILAIGMRRPYRLHPSPPLEDSLISHVDFGLEALSPSFVDIPSKAFQIQAFIWLCKLSEIMAAMAIFQQRTKFARDWSGESIDDSCLELEEVDSLERDLRQWQESFEADMSGFIKPNGDEDNLPIPLFILRIISNSLITVLYQPYLNLSWLDHPTSINITVDPLQRIKEGSQAVETSIVGLVERNKSDVLPNWLVSWVTLPVAVYHVNRYVRLDKNPERVLISLFNRFMRRTTGAQAMFIVLTRATKEYLDNNNGKDESLQQQQSTSTPPPPTTGAGSLTGHHTTSSSSMPADTVHLDTATARHESRHILEAKILAHVSKALDYALELKC